ncbi:hypothetical protein EK21DRAFT_95398 [Setomelanomma holmii]|uniref:Uncharacterized protein n=1 Tax=Setomelanomma holmii TaxID=210430 RepID=A0A9P4GTV5_9PLEO|nr:hypothetical protein EK21DRAFT_95398 [Setomelanomma holmii]
MVGSLSNKRGESLEARENTSTQSNFSVPPSSTTLCEPESQIYQDADSDDNASEYQSHSLAGIGSWTGSPSSETEASHSDADAAENPDDDPELESSDAQFNQGGEGDGASARTDT